MASPKKVIGASIGILAGLLVLTAILTVLFFPRDAVREWALARIERETGRAVAIADVRIDLIPSPQIRLEGLGLTDETPTAKTVLTAEALTLKMRLGPLLRRRVEIDRIELTRPLLEVHLAQKPAEQAAGEPQPRSANIRATGPAREPKPAAGREASPETPTSPASAPPPTVSPVDLHIEEFVITDGGARIFLPDGSMLLEADGFTEHLSASVTTTGHLGLIGTSELATLRLQLPTGSLGRNLTLRLDKDLAYDMGTDRLAIQAATLMIGALPVKISGTVAAIAAGAPTADLRLEGGPAEVADILAYLPAGMLSELEGIESAGTLTLRATLTGELAPQEGQLPDFTVDLRLADGRLQHPALASPITKITLHAQADPKMLQLHNLTAELGRSTLNAQTTITDYMLQPHIEATAESQLQLEDLMPFAGDSLQMVGGATAVLQIAGDLPAPAEEPDPAAFTGTLKLTSPTCMIQNIAARETTARVKFAGGIARAEEFATHVFGGTVSGTGNLDLRDIEKPTFNLQLAARGVEAAELFTHVPNLNRYGKLGRTLSGKIDLDAEMSGDLDDSLSLNLTSLSSNGQLATHGATIAGHPLQNALATYFDQPCYQQLRISDWLQPFVIENGRVAIDGLRMKADRVEITGQGWQALDGSLKMSFDILVPQEDLGAIRKYIPRELVPILFGSSGAPVLIPINLSGRWSAPSVSLNEAALRARAKDQLAVQGKELETELRDGAEKIIGDLLDAKDDSSDVKTRLKQAEKEAKDLLKGLFKKKK